MAVTINSLPNEVFLEVFQYLDYYGLKKCMRVSKAFNAIIKHTAFDSVLFRSAAVIGKDGIIKNSSFALHPAIKCIAYIEGKRVDQIELCGPYSFWDDYDSYDPPKYLLQDKVASEQATSPPVTCLRITLRDALTTVEVENPQGVTIRQLFEAMFSIYEDPATMTRLGRDPDGNQYITMDHRDYYSGGKKEFSPCDLLLKGYFIERFRSISPALAWPA